MSEFHFEEMPEEDEIDDTIPPELDLLSLDDPNLIEELDRRVADDAGLIPWSELKNE